MPYPGAAGELTPSKGNPVRNFARSVSKTMKVTIAVRPAFEELAIPNRSGKCSPFQKEVAKLTHGKAIQAGLKSLKLALLEVPKSEVSVVRQKIARSEKLNEQRRSY